MATVQGQEVLHLLILKVCLSWGQWWTNQSRIVIKRKHKRVKKHSSLICTITPREGATCLLTAEHRLYPLLQSLTTRRGKELICRATNRSHNVAGNHGLSCICVTPHNSNII